MKRIATAIAVSAAAAASLAAPGAASAGTTTAAQTNLDCEKAFVEAVPGFVVRTATYTVENGEPPFIGGPFYPC